MKIVTSIKFSPQELDLLGAEQIFKESLTFDGDIEFCTDEEASEVTAAVCYMRLLTPEFFRKFPNLKWIQLMSVGYERVPVPIIKSRGILVSNARGTSNLPIAEDIICKLFVMAKNYDQYMDHQRKGLWHYADSPSRELSNRRAIVLGAGAIGRETAILLKGVGMDVDAYDICSSECTLFGHIYDDKKILLDRLSLYDCVILSMPYSKETHEFADKTFFDHMKTGSYLINVARGGLVKIDDLCRALDTGKVGKAALDVFPEEPLKPDNALWHQKNLLITPHQAYLGENTPKRLRALVLDNLKAFSEGRPLKYLINFE